MNRPVSICFVARHALPVLLEMEGAPDRSTGAGMAGGAPSRMGGAELQQALVAHELARRGHRVTFLVAESPEHGTGRGIAALPGAVRAITYASPSSDRSGAHGEPVLGKGRRLARETGALLRAILKADADVYSVRSDHLCAAMVAVICKTLVRPFIFASGHDGNCDPAMAHRPLHPVVAAAYAAALRSAAAVVVQGETQRVLIGRSFGVAARVIPSAVPPAPARYGGAREGVLWVGCIEPRKGPDRALDVAASAPGVRLTLVGGPGDHQGFHDALERRAAGLPNVRWLGPLPHARTLELFDGASIYLNTSRSEGYPNTFLEAWMRGVPVASMSIDPDGCLSAKGLGLLTGGPSQTARAILDLIGAPRRREALAEAGRRHVESRHALATVADAWEALLREVAAPGHLRAETAAGVA